VPDKNATHEHAHAQLDFGAGPAGAHAPGISQARMVKIERDILSKNDSYAQENRRYLSEHGIFALNLVSSPGSGKTTLLVKSINALNGSLPLVVIEGDQQTDNDAARIRATGAQALQINTGKGCHLDAYMIGQAMQQLSLPDDSLLLIENVGNLVCPASFDLGEAHKVAILSVTEGEDKPLKYPDMFRASDLMLLNKCDLLPYLDFDTNLAIENARRVNPNIQIIRISATSGEGMDEWLEWVKAGCRKAVERN
jgi:hydrogenase nickel incorporation protein HypB